MNRYRVISFLQVATLVLVAASPGLRAAEETVTFGRVGAVAIYRETTQPTNLVSFVSGDGGWNTGYDFTGLHYVGKRLPIVQVATASFIAYAVGHNVGLAMLSGGSVRLRLYSRAGLSALEVGKVIAVCTVTFGLGVSAVFALVCALAPADVTAFVPVSATLVRGVGVLMLLTLVVTRGGFEAARVLIDTSFLIAGGIRRALGR